jgi:citrate lyase subunit beta/citryl-CoA lyase
LRSILVVPAHDAPRLAACIQSGADAVCLDLANPDGATRSRARRNACEMLLAVRTLARRPRLYVRVNGLDTAHIEADVDAAMPGAPDGVVLPECLSGQSLQHLGAMLAVREARCGLADGSTRIIGMAAATAASIFAMGSFAGASRRLAALTWSAADLAAALGAEISRDANGCYTAPFVLARSLTLCAARAAGVLAIDGLATDFSGGPGLRLECEAARRDGFDAKLAADQDQVEIINSVFGARRG